MKLTNTLLAVAVVAAAGTGCATKKYVGTEVGQVNQKVDALSGEVEKTQERVKSNEAQIGKVDQDAQSGIRDAKSSAVQAMSRADAAEKAAKGKLIYEVTLSADDVTFPFNRATLSDKAEERIDELAQKVTAENRGVYFEIEGHTDSIGTKEYNYHLGEERATAVRNYLHDKHNIALNRIEVISYGADKPVNEAKTRAARAENRRVVIKVLE
jgi:outer membrane protein OmpA-like peptidoglycan-associated protein